MSPPRSGELEQRITTLKEELAKADVAQLAQKTGLSESSLREFKGKAVGLTLIQDLRGITPETVKTHIKSILRKLGVQTRTSHRLRLPDTIHRLGVGQRRSSSE